MTPPRETNPKSDEMALAEAKAQLGARGPTPRPNPLASEEEVVTKYTRTRFASILNELDMRSRKSNKWLSALSIIYVIVVIAITVALFYQYSALERGIAKLDEGLAETDKAIEDQANEHEEQSRVISGRIDETGKVLTGVTQEASALDIKLESGMEKADELEAESERLEKRIEEFDTVSTELVKHAQPFGIHYSVNSNSPIGFDPDKATKLRFDKFVSLNGADDGNIAKADGSFAIPSSGTFVVAGWFSTRVAGELVNSKCVVETEVRVDETPVWKGFSHVNGNFTAAVPLTEGQSISIYATMRFTDEKSEKSGTIESGDIRISRVGFLP